MANAVNPYGDGRAAERSLAAMAHYFGIGPKPEEFAPVLDSDLDTDLLAA
jgi:UDP-N-acetylglucosamine 2-epimerase (non-hydrolysing)